MKYIGKDCKKTHLEMVKYHLEKIKNENYIPDKLIKDLEKSNK